MAYVKTVWVNGPSGGTPIDASALNNIENGIEELSLDFGEWITRTNVDDGTSVGTSDKVFVDTTGGAFGLVLPSSPNNGDTVKFVDVKGNFETNNFTISVPSGTSLMGVVDDNLVLVSNYDFVDMTYFAADDNWIITNKP